MLKNLNFEQPLIHNNYTIYNVIFTEDARYDGELYRFIINVDLDFDGYYKLSTTLKFIGNEIRYHRNILSGEFYKIDMYGDIEKQLLKEIKQWHKTYIEKLLKKVMFGIEFLSLLLKLKNMYIFYWGE